MIVAILSCDTYSAPPNCAELLRNLVLRTTNFAWAPTQIAPPKPEVGFTARLSLKTLVSICARALPKMMNMAPPPPAVFFWNVLLLMYTGPVLKMAPPA